MQLIRTDSDDGASRVALASARSMQMTLKAREANRSAHATRQSSKYNDLA